MQNNMWFGLAKMALKTGANVYANKQVVGLRSVQKAYESAKCIIVNVASGVFPKSSIE